MIPVTEPYLPPRERLDRYLDRIYESRRLTNNGPLVQELTEKLKDYLGVENLLLVANGTLALQIAYRTLGVSGSAVTTPFTFPATVAAMDWNDVEPIYSDVDFRSMNLDPEAAEDSAKPETTAVVPVHTYGNPCDVEAFASLAQRRRLKLIYDASHCFGVNYYGTSILNWGDAATLSFHATKLFSTVEGGAIIFRNREDLELARTLINFGIQADGTREGFGINAKMSEFQAAYGLASLPDIDKLIKQRLYQVTDYQDMLGDVLRFPEIRAHTEWNGAYCSIVTSNEGQTLRVQKGLWDNDIQSRRYFRPLDPVFDREPLNSVLCLPLLPRLDRNQIERIAAIVRTNL